jgi:hypothetical protein
MSVSALQVQDSTQYMLYLGAGGIGVLLLLALKPTTTPAGGTGASATTKPAPEGPQPPKPASTGSLDVSLLVASFIITAVGAILLAIPQIAALSPLTQLTVSVGVISWNDSQDVSFAAGFGDGMVRGRPCG